MPCTPGEVLSGQFPSTALDRWLKADHSLVLMNYLSPQATKFDSSTKNSSPLCQSLSGKRTRHPVQTYSYRDDDRF